MPRTASKRRNDEQPTDTPPALRRASPALRRASPAASRSSGVSQVDFDRAIAAGIAAHKAETDARIQAALSARDAGFDARIAQLMASFQAELQQQKAKAEDNHLAVVQHGNAELASANRVHDLLRAEVRDAHAMAHTESASAKQHHTEAASARELLTEARAHHAASAEHQERVSQGTARLAVRDAEAEAQHKHAEAMLRVESEANRRHEGIVEHLRSELAAALQDPRGHTNGPQPACLLCPVKQGMIDKLNAQLDDERIGKDKAQKELREVHDRAACAETDHKSKQYRYEQHLQELAAERDLANRKADEAAMAASAQEATLAKQLEEERNGASADRVGLQSKHDAAMSAASAERDDLRQQLHDQQVRYQRQLAEAKSQHGDREAELAGHAETLAQELEQVKLDLASRPLNGHAGLERDLRHANSTIGDLRDVVTSLRNQLSTMERLAGHAHAQNTMLIKQAASTHSRSNCGSQSHRSDHHYMGDDEDEYNEVDDDDWFADGSQRKQSVSGFPINTAAMTQTVPPATTTLASGAASASGGGGGRPPRSPSDGVPGNGDGSHGSLAHRRTGRKPQQGDGGGGPPGGGGGDGNGGGDDDDRATRRRRRIDDSDADAPTTRKKEGEEIKVTSLPRHAAECQPWLDSTTDAFTACARDAQEAFKLMLRIEADDCTFDELALTDPSNASLEAKLRSAITKHTIGAEAQKNPDLVSKLIAVREELKRGPCPRQITGRQLVWTIRHFFRIDDDNAKTSFELTTLLAITWPGDAKMGQFKARWDHIVRNLRSPLSKRDLEDILVPKLRGSELLKPHLDYYDRLPTTHPDRCYDWVSQLIDTLVSKEQQSKNKTSLVLDASGKEQLPQKPKAAMPVQQHGQGTQQGGHAQGGTPAAGIPATDAQDGKGGKGPGGKRGGRRGGGSPTNSDHGSQHGQKPPVSGKTWAEIPTEQRCCIMHLWGRCKNPKDCKHGPHLDKPTDGVKEHGLYKTMLRDRGEPKGPKKSGSEAAGSDKND